MLSSTASSARMAEIRWGPWSGASRKSHRVPASSSAWSLDDDLIGLQKAMSSMMTDPSLSDVCLVVEGIDVPSHKAVLAAWSRPFRAMFTLPMLESRHQCRVVIEDAEHKHLVVVLRYLYSGRIGLNDENVMPVSALANRYEVLPLMAQCEGYMKWRLDPSNVVAHLLSAEDHGVPKAADFALEYLAVHFDEVHHDSSSDFNSLGGDTVLRLLQHDGLTVDEETVFLAVEGWAKAWEHRRSIRGAIPNYAVGRSPPPAVAEQSSALHHGSSRTPSVKKTLSVTATNFPPPTAVLLGDKNAKQQSGGRVDSVTKGESSSASAEENLGSLSGRKRSDSGAGRTLGSNGAGGILNQAHRGRTDETGRSAATMACQPCSVALPVAATMATTVSASAAAGAAAVVAGRVEQEQGEGRQQSQQASTPPTVNVAVTTGSSTTIRDAHADVTTVAPSCGNRDRNGRAVKRSTRVTGEESPERAAVEAVRGALERRASGPAGGKENGGGWVSEVLGRPASFSEPPRLQLSVGSVRKEAAGVCSPGSPIPIDAVVEPRKETSETMAPMPEEERAFLDELLKEVRFPLVSTSFLCRVVEKSPVISGSRVAQRLLHEAYKFIAIRQDAVDVGELFPGNHRVKFRGHERVLFGEGDGCVGHVDDYSSSLSEVHLVENVKRRDEKYWLPGQPEEAYLCVRLDRVRRITKFRFQNRYSEEFEVAIRRTRREEWQVVVPRQKSGGHKDVTSLDLTQKRVKAMYVKISLTGRKRSCYNTSCYWAELLGF